MLLTKRAIGRLKYFFSIYIYIFSLIIIDSIFLADINNMKRIKNPEYKRVIGNLDNFIMIKWANDTTIIPKVFFN